MPYETRKAKEPRENGHRADLVLRARPSTPTARSSGRNPTWTRTTPWRPTGDWLLPRFDQRAHCASIFNEIEWKGEVQRQNQYESCPEGAQPQAPEDRTEDVFQTDDGADLCGARRLRAGQPRRHPGHAQRPQPRRPPGRPAPAVWHEPAPRARRAHRLRAAPRGPPGPHGRRRVRHQGGGAPLGCRAGARDRVGARTALRASSCTASTSSSARARAWRALTKKVDKLGEGDAEQQSSPIRRADQADQPPLRETMRFLFSQGVAVLPRRVRHPARRAGRRVRARNGRGLLDLGRRPRADVARERGAPRRAWARSLDGPAHRTTTRGQATMDADPHDADRGALAVHEQVSRHRRAKTFAGRVADISARDGHRPASAPAPPTSKRRRGSGKRKKKKAGAADPKAALVNNGKRRNAHEQHCLNLAVNLAHVDNRCNFETSTSPSSAATTSTARPSTRRTASSATSCRQAGATGPRGSSTRRPTRSATTLDQVRALPRRNVNVVQSVAFAGAFGRCARCGHRGA